MKIKNTGPARCWLTIDGKEVEIQSGEELSLAPEVPASDATETAVALLVVMENVMDTFADRVEKIALEMRSPNPDASLFLGAVVELRQAVTKIKARGIELPQRDEDRK